LEPGDEAASAITRLALAVLLNFGLASLAGLVNFGLVFGKYHHGIPVFSCEKALNIKK
jgi:hypothetical protein